MLHNTSISLNYSNFEPQSKYTHTIIFSHLNIQNDYLNSNRRGMTERKRKIKTEHTKERKLAHKLKKQSKAKQKFHHNINFNWKFLHYLVSGTNGRTAHREHKILFIYIKNNGQTKPLCQLSIDLANWMGLSMKMNNKKIELNLPRFELNFRTVIFFSVEIWNYIEHNNSSIVCISFAILPSKFDHIFSFALV